MIKLTAFDGSALHVRHIIAVLSVNDPEKIQRAAVYVHGGHTDFLVQETPERVLELLEEDDDEYRAMDPLTHTRH